ncbi:tyrosine--tRNA ligase [Brachybacterium sacelli]|uniref:Tyrosine--tRNA ligase n=1 Tax=Brachybacterium sacelli TaxID=173364 RepID=A0ABS4WVT4_9MICO|nr:tyrosine--tRNA ligase [Brachybacterium sacelli]MBP2380310.1 tyrosyl-tRNA synthetase [Brachybacterium sacelli]
MTTPDTHRAPRPALSDPAGHRSPPRIAVESSESAKSPGSPGSPDSPDSPDSPEAILARLERTTDQIIGREDLVNRLREGRPLRIKFGVDLTAPDLHLGHAVNLWMMRTLQDLGHVVIFLLGDTTSRIGDPTGRSTTRPVLTPQQIHDNAESFLEQVTRVLRSDAGLLEIRRNSEWFDEMGVPGLLQELSLVTHAHLISRDMFRARIGAGTEIAMHELIYPVLQGFDSVALGSDLTIVGTDQLFNESMGRELQVKHGQIPQTVISSTVTPGLDGGPKQSKSRGNYVGLCASPGEKFGRLMTLRDELVGTWAQVYTDLPMDQVSRLGELALAGGSAARDAKLDLAEAVVRRHDGAAAARHGREEFLRVFSAREQPSDMAPLPLGTGPITALDLVATARPELSRSAARRLLTGGGVHLDGMRLEDPERRLELGDGHILRAGRRRWFRTEG